MEKMYMVQARPETVASQREGTILEEYHLTQQAEPLISGRAGG
jgi:pyruvate,water dikinase